MVINDLGVFTGNIKRLRDEVRNVLANKHIRVEVGGVDLLGEV